tara:strand:- start:234 stop:986 length:753 start_codon:yes stop_codon:yes gene_type:complete
MFYSKKLKKFKNINHCFFSKKGGFSKGIYKSLNCGRGSQDSKKKIQKNLLYVSNKMFINKKKLILMHQTHSNKVIEIKQKKLSQKIISDAMITKVRGLALGVVTADCVPILIYNYNNQMVGCVHAGWKGALSGIIQKTISKMREPRSRNLIYASVGPCIGKESYEVDKDFFQKFIIKSKKNKKYFFKKNKFKMLFNLRKYVADKLLEQRVKVDHVNFDTFKDKNYFFSYRRSFILKQKDYGRCISVIGLT